MKVAQLCPTLCDPMDRTVHAILQARILEWVDFLFSRGSGQPRNQTRVSCIADGFFTNWAIREALQNKKYFPKLSQVKDWIRNPQLPPPSLMAQGFPGGAEVKASACNVGDLGSIPGWERPPGEGNGNPLQYSCLEKPRGQKRLVGCILWGHKSWTRLSD